MPLHTSPASPEEHFQRQMNPMRTRNDAADLTWARPMPPSSHETSYDGYPRAPGQERRSDTFWERPEVDHQQISNDRVAAVGYQYSNHQYPPANDAHYPQHIDDGGRSHDHPTGIVSDFHPGDTNHHHRDGVDRRRLPVGITNPPDQEVVILQTRSARSEPPPRTPRHMQQHPRIHKSESEAGYYRNGNRGDSKYVDASHYDNTNHDYSTPTGGHRPIDALCCGDRRDVDDRGYDVSQRYENRPHRRRGGGDTPRPGYYVDSPKVYEMERQRQNRVQQYYRENDGREYRDLPPRGDNNAPLSPLSIPSCVDVPVENQYDYNQHDNNGHPKGGVMMNLPINHGNTNHHHRYTDDKHESIPVVPRHAVYPRKEHMGNSRHHYESNAAVPPPFERRDDSCGSSTIYTGSSPRQLDGNFLVQTPREYSPRTDFESGRDPYTTGKYRDEPARLRIEIPTTPQVITTANNQNSVSSRPPLHTKLGQQYGISPIAINAELERRKSEARHQILKEIVSGRHPLLCMREIYMVH